MAMVDADGSCLFRGTHSPSWLALSGIYPALSVPFRQRAYSLPSVDVLRRLAARKDISSSVNLYRPCPGRALGQVCVCVCVCVFVPG